MKHKYFIPNALAAFDTKKGMNNYRFTAILVFLLFSFANAQTTVNLNPATANPWTVPAGVTSINVQVWGGGGAGGASNNNNDGGSGGGAGGYAASTNIPVTPGSTIPYTVGLGGTAAQVATAQSGGQSTFLALTANGGAGGTRSGGAGGAGGTATGGNSANTTGGNGGGGGGNTGGNGGTAPAGGGTGGAGAANGNGGNGNIIGGGGGGGEYVTFSGNRIGGNGARGQIIITYTIPTITLATPLTGCPGDVVTITGANFTGASVTFNGTPASILTNNGTTMTVSVPLGATTGPIRVTIANGFAQTANFTTNQPVLGGPSSVCEGGSVMLTASTTGVWVSNNPAVATINSVTGQVTGVSSGVTTFTFTPTPSGCAMTTPSFNVYGLPSITASPSPQSVCSGSAATFTVTATGGGLTYQWYNGATMLVNGGNISGATSPTLTLNPVATSDASADYHCVVSGFCTPQATSASASLTVTERVVITAQPAVSQTLCSGNTATFAVAATGAGLTYQWFNGATSLTDGGNISGATSNTLTLSNLTTADASSNYYCMVSGTAPCTFVNSNNSALIVNQGPAITAEPMATQTVCAGNLVSLNVTATGGGLIYRWYRGATMLSDTGNTSGSATETLTINPAQPADSGNDYYCVVSNGCVIAATSAMAEIIVNERPFVPAQALSVCSEDAFDATPFNAVPDANTVVPSGTTYSWAAPVVTGGLTGGSAQSGQTLISQTLVNPTNAVQTATYTVTPVSGTSGNCAGTPFTVIVSVSPKPFIVNMLPQACSGETFTISPTNGGGNIVPAGTVYSWGMPTVTGGLTGATALSGQTSFSQTLVNPTNAVQTATYNITATSGLCVGSTFTVTMTINPKPTVAGDIAAQSICPGAAISPITITNPNAVPGATSFSWTRDNAATVTGMAASGSGNTINGTLFNATNIPQTTVFTLYAISEDGCQSLPQTVSVTVNPTPVPSAAPMTQTVCSTFPVNINLNTSNAVAGTTFSWTRDNTVNVTGIASSGNGNTISGTPVNTTNVPQTVTFTITATANGCSSSISTVTVTVRPQPTAIASPAAQTVCGQTPIAAIAFGNPNSVAGVSFSWTRDNTANVTGIAASGSGSSIAGTLTNLTNVDQIVTFTITASAAGCASVATTAQVTVMPSPLMTATPAGQSVCSGSAMTPITFNNTNSVPGTTYSWTRTNTANITGLPASGNFNPITGTLTNITGTTQSTVITMTATAPNGCTSVSTATVNVYAPRTTPVIGADQVVCAGETPTMIVMTSLPSGGGPTTTYQWQSSTVSNTGPWTNITGATGSTYQPPATTASTLTTYYRLVSTNCGTTMSNAVSVTVVNNQNFSFSIDFGNATLCPGETFSPYVFSYHGGSVRIRYSYTADPTYISPAIGPQTGASAFVFLGWLSGATLPMTVMNNTNANVTTTISITPHVYNSSMQFICSLSPQTTTVTIRPNPTATPMFVPSDPICSGTSAGVVVDGNLTNVTMGFNWVRVDGNANVTSSQPSGSVSGLSHPNNFYTIPDVLTNNSSSVQTVTYQVTPTSAQCTGTPILITVSVNSQLLPGNLPANQTVCNGDNPAVITPTAATGGGTLTYQWQSSTVSAAGPWTDIFGETGATYDPPAGPTGTIYYRRVVTSTVNGVTCSIANTTSMAVVVNNVTGGSINGNQTICSNSIPGTTLGNAAAGTGSGAITYQWQSSTVDCNSGWANILGATGATYTIPVALTVTTYYRRVATSTLNSVGCTANSNCVTVTVNNVTAGTIGSDQVLCGNNPAAFTSIVAPTGSGVLSYQWQSTTAADCNSGWANISGATGLVYDAPAGLLVTTRYRRITTSTLNGVPCTAISNCIVVTANSVTGGTIAGNRTVCNGGDPAAFTQSVASTGTNITYQWQYSLVGGTGPWTNIIGATAATYDAPGPITQTTYFQRVTFSEISSVSCSANSNFVTVFVNNVTAPVIAGDQTVCSSDNPTAFTTTTPATFAGTPAYQWQSSTVSSTGPWTNIATTPGYDAPPVTFTTYYQLVVTSTLNSVACSAVSNVLTITSNAKVWNGSAGTNWNVAANWSPSGVPTASHCVVIPNVANDPVISGTNFVGYAMNLTVLNGGNLNVASGNSMQVTNFVNVNAGGVFFISDDASLVQIDNVANTGIVSIQRTTQPVYKFDYTYWNSPVTLASNYTLGNLSPLTQPDKFYSWNPSVSGGNGNWVQESVATIMNPHKGYIVRAPNGYSSNPAITAPYTATFNGTPNNGNLLTPVLIGSLAPAVVNDKLNLIGNPYPSAIDADLFLNHATNASLLDGTMYFWTHHSPPSVAYPDPFYGNFTSNYTASDYATYTSAMGGTSTVPSGYGGAAPNGYVASGQSFFIKAISSGNAVFDNSMRVTGNNNVFFRMSNPFTSSKLAVERHRIWLNLANAQGAFSQILVGYAEGATNGKDRNYDGDTFASNAVSFYSLLDQSRLTIQGRALPFEVTDTVPLGYKATIAASFTIGIDHLDGLFESQNVYIEDKLLNVIHDIKAAPYTFSSAIGVFNDRFVLRYTDQQLGVGEPGSIGTLVAFVKHGKLRARADIAISTIDVFDISGKRVASYAPEAASFEHPFPFAQGVYIAKVTLDDGSTSDIKLAN